MMKTGVDIRKDFPGTKTETFGKDNLYTCIVTFLNGEQIKGYGSSFEKAEDTAWYGAKITLQGDGI